ncbi:MAG TPA: DUF4231 domain-containing protein [Longimicrobium sp.]|jgi:hypothetical protein
MAQPKPQPSAEVPNGQIGEREYIAQRVQDQIDWYGDKSGAAQSRFKLLRTVEIVLAASLPLLTTINPARYPWQPLAVSLVGVVVAVIAGLLALNQYQDHWIKYRTTAESLKHEKFRYLTRAEPYNGADAFALLVSRVESLISQENSSWAQLASSTQAAHENGARPDGGGPHSETPHVQLPTPHAEPRPQEEPTAD